MKRFRSMRLRDDRCRTDDAGMTTVTYVMATALSLIVVLFAIQAIVMSYTKAAVRQALAEGARAGVVETQLDAAQQVCEQRMEAVLEHVVAASLRAVVHDSCAADASGITASATIDFRGWTGNAFGGTLAFRTTLRQQTPWEERPDERAGA
jgi:Flp pilus assembly protein TadG